MNEQNLWAVLVVGGALSVVNVVVTSIGLEAAQVSHECKLRDARTDEATEVVGSECMPLPVHAVSINLAPAGDFDERAALEYRYKDDGDDDGDFERDARMTSGHDMHRRDDQRRHASSRRKKGRDGDRTREKAWCKRGDDEIVRRSRRRERHRSRRDRGREEVGLVLEV